MSIKGLVLPQILKFVPQLEPFFFRIPPRPLAIGGICPYAFHVVQHGKFSAYRYYWASLAVVARFSVREKRVLLKTLERPLFRKENVRGNTFARCADLPPELARHVLKISLYVTLCLAYGPCCDRFPSTANFVGLCPFQCSGLGLPK